MLLVAEVEASSRWRATTLPASFNIVAGICVGNTNVDIFLSDSTSHLIKRTTSAGGAVTVVAGDVQGHADSSYGLTANLDRPGTMIYIPQRSAFYFCEGASHVIRSVASGSNFAVSTILGTYGTSGSSGSLLNTPSGLASSADGSVLYWSERVGCLLRSFVFSSSLVARVSGTYQMCSFLDGADKNSAYFNSPEQLARNSAGDLVVADRLNFRIRRVVVGSGAATTLACSGVQGDADGSALAATCDSPFGLAVSPLTGTVYFTEYARHTLRQVSGGKVVTIIGVAGAAGSTDGFGTYARFANPWQLAFGQADHIMYVAQNNNRVVRVVDQTASPSITQSRTAVQTRTVTESLLSATGSDEASLTQTTYSRPPTLSDSSSATPSISQTTYSSPPTLSATQTPTHNVSYTKLATPTSSAKATASATISPTEEPSLSRTLPVSVSQTASPTVTQTITPPPTPTPTFSPTEELSLTATLRPTPTQTLLATSTRTDSLTEEPSLSRTATSTSTQSTSLSTTASVTVLPTRTESLSEESSASKSAATPSGSASFSQQSTWSVTASATTTVTLSDSQWTASATWSASLSATFTISVSRLTMTLSGSGTSTLAFTHSVSEEQSLTATETVSISTSRSLMPSLSHSQSMSATERSGSSSASSEPSSSKSGSADISSTRSPTRSRSLMSASQTVTHQQSQSTSLSASTSASSTVTVPLSDSMTASTTATITCTDSASGSLSTRPTTSTTVSSSLSSSVSLTQSETLTTTNSFSASQAPTDTLTASASLSSTASLSVTSSSTLSASSTLTAKPTGSTTLSRTIVLSATPSSSISISQPSPSTTIQATLSVSGIESRSRSSEASSSGTLSPSGGSGTTTATSTETRTPAGTPSPTKSSSPTARKTGTGSISKTPPPTLSESKSRTAPATRSPSHPATESVSGSLRNGSASPSRTPSEQTLTLGDETHSATLTASLFERLITISLPSSLADPHDPAVLAANAARGRRLAPSSSIGAFQRLLIAMAGCCVLLMLLSLLLVICRRRSRQRRKRKGIESDAQRIDRLESGEASHDRPAKEEEEGERVPQASDGGPTNGEGFCCAADPETAATDVWVQPPNESTSPAGIVAFRVQSSLEAPMEGPAATKLAVVSGLFDDLELEWSIESEVEFTAPSALPEPRVAQSVDSAQVDPAAASSRFVFASEESARRGSNPAQFLANSQDTQEESSTSARSRSDALAESMRKALASLPAPPLPPTTAPAPSSPPESTSNGLPDATPGSDTDILNVARDLRRALERIQAADDEASLRYKAAHRTEIEVLMRLANASLPNPQQHALPPEDEAEEIVVVNGQQPASEVQLQGPARSQKPQRPLELEESVMRVPEESRPTSMRKPRRRFSTKPSTVKQRMSLFSPAFEASPRRPSRRPAPRSPRFQPSDFNNFDSAHAES